MARVVGDELTLRILSAVHDGRDARDFEHPLHEQGTAAARTLLNALTERSRDQIPGILQCLEYCWHADAEESVEALLVDEDAGIRKAAAQLLDRSIGRRRLAEHCASLVDIEDAGIAEFAASHAEPALPDLERMVRFAEHGGPPVTLYRYLSRYYDVSLTPASRRLLEHDDLWLRRAAILGLAMQNDTSDRTRERIAACLEAPVPWLREAAAEYFLRLVAPTVRDRLLDALQRETDLQVRAALSCAIERIEQAREQRAPIRSDLSGETPLIGRFQAAIDCHAERCESLPSSITLDLLGAAEPFEPVWMMDDQGEAGKAFEAERDARFTALQTIFSMPGIRDSSGTPGAQTAPECGALTPPVFDFPEQSGASFGHHLGSQTRLFSSQVHIGEDVAWYHNQATVTAIAPGFVRACGLVPTWGYLVLVEHRADAALSEQLMRYFGFAIEAFDRSIAESVFDERGRLQFCSLYAHLGADLTVRRGMQVAGGQRLGSVGRSYTWENGGYGAHLHFAIHLGPRMQRPARGAVIDCNYKGRPYRARVTDSDAETTYILIRKSGEMLPLELATEWVRGYISDYAWRTRAHGWMPPASFIALAS